MRRLMVYGYEHDHDLTNVNLGDYIQSIAANQFMRTLSRESYFSRDNMEVLRQNDFAILNGWYRIDEKAHLLRFPVNVLPVSIHVSNPEATEDIRKVIAEWEINGDGGIGCRDLSTLNLLKKKWGLMHIFPHALRQHCFINLEELLSKKGRVWYFVTWILKICFP